MNGINKSSPNIKIYFDTVEYRTIYYILNVLRSRNVSYVILKEKSVTDADVIISDNFNTEDKVIQTKTITYDPITDFVMIITKIFGGEKDCLFLGVDPGKRTGVAVYLGKRLILNEVISPWEDAVLYIVKILSKIECSKKIVKIGSGNLKVAEELKRVLKTRFEDLDIYFVNEQRTTISAKKKKNQGREKDKISAISIVHKNGEKVV
ncbi:MAG: hypothetical protein ACP5PT_06465, partial [Brevinematia bacterium]